MSAEPIAASAVAATSVATVALATVGEGLDSATITIIGVVASAIITSLSVAIVKILGALQEMKVAMITAAAERGKLAEKTTEHTAKLTAIGASSNGALSAMGERLDEALRRIDEMQKAAATARVISPAPSPVPGSPSAPVEMKIVNPPQDPANVTNVEPKA